MLEKDVERRLCNKVAAVGGKAYKFTSPGRRSVPDRICLFPGGKIAFVEVKAPTGTLTKLQKQELRMLRILGQKAFVVYSYDDVDDLIRLFKGGNL